MSPQAALLDGGFCLLLLFHYAVAAILQNVTFTTSRCCFYLKILEQGVQNKKASPQIPTKYGMSWCDNFAHQALEGLENWRKQLRSCKKSCCLEIWSTVYGRNTKFMEIFSPSLKSDCWSSTKKHWDSVLSTGSPSQWWPPLHHPESQREPSSRTCRPYKREEASGMLWSQCNLAFSRNLTSDFPEKTGTMESIFWKSDDITWETALPECRLWSILGRTTQNCCSRSLMSQFCSFRWIHFFSLTLREAGATHALFANFPLAQSLGWGTAGWLKKGFFGDLDMLYIICFRKSNSTSGNAARLFSKIGTARSQ